MANPTRYAIEIRDRAFNLKKRVEDMVTSLSWDWNRIGGCGKCSLKMDGDYKAVDIQTDDDIRIYLPNATSGATLWYRGFVTEVSPTISTGNKGSIQIQANGYFGWMDRIVIHDDGQPKVYSSAEVSAIVDALIDTYIVPVTSITKGTIDASNYTPDTISFKTSARDALKTLFDLLGAVEYGVGADLAFYWRTQSSAIAHVFYIGDHVDKINDRVDFSNIVNKIYFEGGDVNGTTLQIKGQSQSSINRYGRFEEILSNGSIVTASVANRYISGILRQRGFPQRQISIGLKNTTKRLEASLPIGACSVVDEDYNQTTAIYGTTANGGSNIIYGKIINGGTGKTYGGSAKHQVDRITYTLSPENGRVHADIQFGSSISFSRASATLKQIEQTQSALRQRSL